MSAFATLGDFVAHLQHVEVVPRPAGEEWAVMIARISVPGTVAEIDDYTWNWFLECLPPKYMMGGLFAFAEGAEPLRIFWKRQDTYFVRPLTWDETNTFCYLAGIPFPD